MRKLSFYLLWIFVFSIPWQDAVSIAGGTALTRIIGVVAFAVAFAACLIERKMKRPPFFVYVFFAFVVWQLLTYFWSVGPSTTLGSTLTLVQVFVMIWLITELCTAEKERIWLLEAFVLGCLVVCFLLVSAYARGEAADTYRYSTANLSLNDSAQFIAAGIAMAFIVIASGRKAQIRRHAILMWVNTAYILIALFSVVLTASRSGFIATCIALVGAVFALRQVRLAQRLAWVVVIMGVFAGVFFGLSSSEALQANTQRITFSADTASLETLTGRTEIWSTGGDLFREHPIGGMGAGTFVEAARERLGESRAAHNVFVETAVETGIVGVLLLVTVLMSALVPVLISRNESTPLYVILFLVLFAIAQVANVAGGKAFWCSMAILSLSAVLRKREAIRLAAEGAGLSQHTIDGRYPQEVSR
ncbi:MAG: O-antigen ligase family protein [Thermoleophilia bacterium]|nr:O-antigen ligase family protein [Thermoleophilia bacterium]